MQPFQILPTLLDWALATASIFNTVVLCWLGLTVVLNAERRGGIVWLAGGGLLLGGLFFAFHTATLDYAYETLVRVLPNWWYAAWLCVIVLPLGWYFLMLWYAGFWESRSSLRVRHRAWFAIVVTGALGLIVLLTVVNPFRVLKQVAYMDTGTPLSGLPWLVVTYPIYVLACLVLAIDAVVRPEPSARMMGDVARRRARPWLIASSVVQLAVSLLLAAVLLWIVKLATSNQLERLVNVLMPWLDALDLLVTSGIAIAVVLLGKAIVSYEIFTNKPLPRRGFLYQWRAVVALSAIFSLLISFVWALPMVPTVYALLMTILLMSASSAIFHWRSAREHEESIAQLRPFVTSQRLYDELLQRPSTPLDAVATHAVDQAPAFRALCEDVLNTQVAFLYPLGPLATLAGAPLAYGTTAAPPALDDLMPQLSTAEDVCFPLPADRYSGAQWAIPLWGEHGLIGVLLLGEKQNGGLFTQEEMEIARASGERLIDMRASATMAQRLMSLQRRQLAESQVVDRRARRTLHDEVLPRLHAAMLALSATPGGGHDESVMQLADAHRQISDLLRDMPTATSPEVARLGLVGALRQTVEREFPGAFDEVLWEVEEDESGLDRLSSLNAEVLFYAAREAIRNAARYGRNTASGRPLYLRVCLLWHDGLTLTIEDNGIGIQPGEAETRESQGNRDKGGSGSGKGGSGSGLALHSTMLAVIGGTLSINSAPDAGTRVTVVLPEYALQNL